MPLELRTQRNGSLRETWYGRYEINGKKFYLNLGIKLAGSAATTQPMRCVIWWRRRVAGWR